MKGRQVIAALLHAELDEDLREAVKQDPQYGDEAMVVQLIREAKAQTKALQWITQEGVATFPAREP